MIKYKTRNNSTNILIKITSISRNYNTTYIKIINNNNTAATPIKNKNTINNQIKLIRNQTIRNKIKVKCFNRIQQEAYQSWQKKVQILYIIYKIQMIQYSKEVNN